MSSKSDWDTHRQKKVTTPVTTKKSDRTSANHETRTRKRYVARVKNVCMAIPFNPTQTLLAFQKEAIVRASSHRKLKKELKLSNRIQFIKLATPHFPQLVDCYANDMLCEIAGEEDILVFQTASDDEKEDSLYLASSTVATHRNTGSGSKTLKSSSAKKKGKREKNGLPQIRPQTAKTSNKHSWSVKGSNTPTPNSTLKYKTKEDSKNKRKSLGVLDANASSPKNHNTKKKHVNKKRESGKSMKTASNKMNHMKYSKSGGDLHGGSRSEEEAEDNNSEGSGYNSGHSGHSGDSDGGETIKSGITANKKKKKKSADFSAFAAEVMNAKKTTQKRNFEEEAARKGRKERVDALKHGRSISLSGATLLHSGANKKKRTKKKSKNSESIYASNVQSKSSKASKRANAFEFITKSKGGASGGASSSTEGRKKKYRFGNRNINVIRPSVVPYEEEQVQMPQYYLDLQYIHGYNGYNQRQNLFLSHDGSELIYPMARTTIMFNLATSTQRHWLDGREAISSICVHPSAPIIVTGHVQKGPDRAIIRVWNYQTMVLHKIIKKMHDAAVLACGWSVQSGYLYTIGAGEMHKLVLWDAVDLFKLDSQNNDAEEILSADYTSKKKNFVNCPIDIVSDMLLGKQDILGFEINPFISETDSKQNEILDEFVCFGRKNVKYYEVKLRQERRGGRTVELVMPAAKTIVMSKLGGRSSEYERCYNCCVWMEHAPSYYLLGGHTGNLYICYKASCLKKVTNLGFESQIGCMIRYGSMGGVLAACWDGKLSHLSVAVGDKLRIKRVSQRMVYVPRSGDEESGLKTFSARCMLFDSERNILYCGLKTNQIIGVTQLKTNEIEESDDKLSSIHLLLDSHYGSVQCLACHPFESYFVTGSDDSTLRIWSCRRDEPSQCLSRFKFDEREKPSTLRFSHSGQLLAVGLTTSKIVILAWNNCNLSRVRAVIGMPFKIDKKLKKSQQMDARNSEFTTEITVIKWSPDDANFAAGHIDAIAHIFSVSGEDDDELSVIPWHHSLDVSNGLIDIQWSADSQWLLTFTKDQDLMVWHLNRSQMIFEHYLYWLDPDCVSFDSAGDDPLMAGWDVEGVFQSYLGWDGTDLNSLSLTRNQFKKTSPVDDYDLKRGVKQQRAAKLLATADNKGGYVRIHNYPALKEQAHHAYSGHANQCKVVQWTNDDQYLISVGGADRSVFQWKLTNQITSYIKKYKAIKSANPFKK